MIGDEPKPPPHSIEAEQSVLGAILINNDAFQRVSRFLEPSYFYENIHGIIYQQMQIMIDAGRLASPVTMKTILPADTVLGEGMNLGQYLARLAAEATTIINAPDYAISIRDLYDRRCVLKVAEDMQDPLATDPSASAASAIEQLDAIVASRSGAGSPTVSMAQSIDRALSASDEAYKSDSKVTGLPMGLSALDVKLNGAQKTDLIVVGGRPSSGKTSLAMSVSRSMAESGAGGLIFSLEMNDIQLSTRMIADAMYDHGEPITYADIAKGKFGSNDFGRIREAADRIRDLPIKIDQTPNLTVSQMAARARQMKRRGKLGFMVVDHLGFVRDSVRSGNRSESIGNITAGFKGLAKELEIPIILLCQLSRGVESREDKRPQMSDLRDSGNIEQDADVVMMVYREAYYLERKEPAVGTSKHLAWAERLSDVYHRMDVIVEKNRMGPIGECRLFCDIKSNCIRNEGHTPGSGNHLEKYMPAQLA